MQADFLRSVFKAVARPRKANIYSLLRLAAETALRLGGWVGGSFLKTSPVTQIPELASGVPDTPSFSSKLR